MVFSVKANKKRIIAVLILLAVIICAFVFMPSLSLLEDEEEMIYSGTTAQEREDFLASFGWSVTSEAVDSRDVIIPEEFSEIYATYNEMQIAQGFDLEPYMGEQCTQYIYVVLNYPDETREIYATLLVCEGVIIGGDISCSEADGFMHGFAIDSAYFGETEITEESTTKETSASVSTDIIVAIDSETT